MLQGINLRQETTKSFSFFPNLDNFFPSWVELHKLFPFFLVHHHPKQASNPPIKTVSTFISGLESTPHSSFPSFWCGRTVFPDCLTFPSTLPEPGRFDFPFDAIPPTLLWDLDWQMLTPKPCLVQIYKHKLIIFLCCLSFLVGEKERVPMAACESSFSSPLVKWFIVIVCGSWAKEENPWR